MKNTPITFPQRKIIKSYRSVTGHFPSIKNDKSIAFESKLENEFFLTLEFDNDVATYQEQSQIEIFFNNKTTIYSADAYIQRPKDSLKKDALVEVKYTTELEKKKEYYEKKFKAIRERTDELDLDFIIYTEADYPSIYITNLKFLYRYKTQQREIKYDDAIKEILTIKKMSADELTEKIATSKSEYIIVANAIWGLVALGELMTDLKSSELNMKSLLELPHECC